MLIFSACSSFLGGMVMNNTTTIDQNDKYKDTVYEKVDFKAEIEPHKLLMLIAGVGSGKNYWVKKLTEKGHEEKGYSPNGYKVLLITSRATTADAQMIKLEADRRFDFENLFRENERWGAPSPWEQSVVCCTNSYIEYFAKNIYKADDSRTHVWDMFDFIVLDEAHSMTCDATFSEAPFHVQRFLSHAHRNSNCHIVLMSGTPAPIKWLFDDNAVTTLNKYNECVHVEPKSVIIRSSDGVDSLIKTILEAEQRIIYFVTTTKSMAALVKALNALGISDDVIGISYSDDKERDDRFSPVLVEKKKRILESLKTKEVLPEDVKIFITTSKNKEGININDEDIKIMFVESHLKDEVIQMAGRVRKGLKELYIISDAKQHASQGSELISNINAACLKDVNDAVGQYLAKHPKEQEPDRFPKVIEKVENMFRYIRYDYFEGKFRRYVGREQGDAQVSRNEKYFQSCIACWNSPANHYGETGYKLLHEWFPDARLDLYITIKPDLQVEVGKLLEDSKLLGVVISKGQRDEIKAKIQALVKTCEWHGEPISENFCMLGPVLKKLGFKIDQAPDTRNGTAFVISKLGDKNSDSL